MNGNFFNFSSKVFDEMVENLIKFYCDPREKRHIIKSRFDSKDNILQISINEEFNDKLFLSSSHGKELDYEEVKSAIMDQDFGSVCWVWLQDGESPYENHAPFEENGLDFHDAYRVMTLELDNWELADIKLDKVVELIKVTTEKESKDFSKVIEENFDLATITLDKYEGICEFCNKDTSGEMYLLKESGVNVACGNIYYENDIAIIDDIAVDVNYRGKGYAKIIMKHLINRSKEMGYKLVCLYATPDGFPVYENLGFIAQNFYMQVYFLERR